MEENQRELEKPAEFTDPDVLYEELIAAIERYHPSDDTSLIHRAYMTAKNAHMDQKRKSGEPYIIHPLCVAIILADLELDKESIIAGLLHDVVEDTILTKEQIARVFGDDVALLVDGVTKLTNLTWTKDRLDIQAENLRRMFLAMSQDIRVILIKLADRLHNMRTLQHMKPEKQREKAKETLEIYAPLADRLGISRVKVELDDLALRYLEPKAYHEIEEKIAEMSQSKERVIESLVEKVQHLMNREQIPSSVIGRRKHIFSIYKKMVSQNKSFDEIYDIFAVRVLVQDLKDCYAALGALHVNFTPLSERFKDYIARPKPNRYQSLHTTLIDRGGTLFEVQIRTYEMDKVAEYGIAAHWKYKEKAKGENPTVTGGEAEKMRWLRQILEWQREMPDSKEFLSGVRNELNPFTDMVYAFTPNGDVKTLPAGSTPIDFAYSIHSAVGNCMVGARVNARMVPLNYVIQNGDRVEILTSQNSRGPSRDWLKQAKSSQARNKINQWFKTELKEENIVRGKELLAAYAKSRGQDWGELNRPEYQEKVLRRYSMHDWDAVLATVGHGGIKEGQVVNRMIEERKRALAKQISDETVLANLEENNKESQIATLRRSGNGIVVKGIHDLAVHFSRCCAPVPGDEIVGFVTRGRGITIHRTDCINILSLPEIERARLITAEWQVPEGEENHYLATIRVVAHNRTGLLVDISRVFTERGLDVKAFNTRTSKQDIATMDVTFEIGSAEEIRSLQDKLRQCDGVIDIERS